MTTNQLQCKKCKKYGDFNEIKLYNLEGKGSFFLCKKCYNDLKKTKMTCRFCNRPILYKATRCPYCGIKLSEKKEKKRLCSLCGSEIKNNSNYCATCGRYLNGREQKNNKQYKSDKKLPMKIITISVFLIVIISIIIGIQAYSSTQNSDENLFTTYDPNASFQLYDAKFVDDMGKISLKIRYNTNSKLQIQILNKYRKPMKTTITKADEKTKIINLHHASRSLLGDTYFIYVKSGAKAIFEEAIYTLGPRLIVNKINHKWRYNDKNYEDILENIFLNVTNNGDMPAYIDHLDVLIDKIHGPYSIKCIENNIILPGETIYLDINTNISDDIFPKENHNLKISILDCENKLLTK